MVLGLSTETMGRWRKFGSPVRWRTKLCWGLACLRSLLANQVDNLAIQVNKGVWNRGQRPAGVQNLGVIGVYMVSKDMRSTKVTRNEDEKTFKV